MSDICEFFKPEPNKYRTCVNLDWHHNGTYRCQCEGEKDCTFWRRQIKGMEDCQMLLDGPKTEVIYTYVKHCHYNRCYCRHLSMEPCVVDSGYNEHVGIAKYCNYNGKRFIDDNKCPNWCPLRCKNE